MRISKYLIILTVIIVLVWLSYFTLKIYSTERKISIRNDGVSAIQDFGSALLSLVPPENDRKLKGENEARTNILLLGIAGKGKPGKNLTDTIMMVSINHVSKKVSLISFPRDFYVPVAKTKYYTKINSIYQYGISNNLGIDPLKNTIEKIINAPIHYFVILDFDGFKKIIDNVGGINIEVEYDIYDPKYPGPNYSYEIFEIKKGWHEMNGETALKYARERHADPQGDFGRAKRQQRVLQSFKNKVFSLSTFLNPLKLNEMLNTLGDNIHTDIQPEEFESFIAMAKKIDAENVNNIVIDAWNKNSLLKVSHIYTERGRAFVLVPRVGNFSEIQDIFENAFEYEKIEKRKEEIAKEKSSVSIVNESGNAMLAQKIKSLLQEKLGIGVTEIIIPHSKSKGLKTSVCDMTGGAKLFSLNEIIKKLPAELDSSKDNCDIIETESDFIVILGQDLEKIYSHEEGSLEEFKNSEDSQEYFELIEN